MRFSNFSIAPRRLRVLSLCAAVMFLAIAAVALLPGGESSNAAAPGAADKAYVNGRVLLYPDSDEMMSSDIGWAQAVAVRDGKISYVGDDEGVKQQIDSGTEIVDLKNRLMMPSLGDGHLHGGTEPMCNMKYEGGTVEDVLGKLKACLLRDDQVAHLNSNYRLSASYLMGEGMLPAGTRLDRHVLDRLSKDPSEDEFGTGTTRPIVVGHMDFHKTYTNTKAIVNAGLDENTPDPTDGFIGRDEDGYPNGQFADFRANWGPSLPAAPDANYLGRVQNIEFANSLGITAIHRPGGGLADLNAAKRLADEGELTVKLNQGLAGDTVRGETNPAVLDTWINGLNANRSNFDGYTSPESPGEVKVNTIKVFCDGVPEFPGQTAAMLEPYRTNVGTPENPQWVEGTWRGEEPSCEDAELGFVKLDRAKWNIHIHSLGDRSTRVSLDNFETAMKENATWDRRNSITHLQFIDDRDIPRFGELGVIASVQHQFNQRDGWSVDGIEGYIAPDRKDNMYPTKDLLDGGAVIAQGADWPVTPLVPWTAIEQAVTREGQVNPARAIYPGQLNGGDAITLEQAIKSSTIGVAYQMGFEKETGSIEVGKDADLIAIDKDPYNPPGGELEAMEDAKSGLAAATEGLKAEESSLASAQAGAASAVNALTDAKGVLGRATAESRKAKAARKKARANLKKAKASKAMKKKAKAKKKARVKRAKKRLDRANRAAEGAAAKARAADKAASAAATAASSADRAVESAKDAVEAAKQKVTTGKATVSASEAAYEAAKAEAIKSVDSTKVLLTDLVGERVYTAPESPLED